MSTAEVRERPWVVRRWPAVDIYHHRTERVVVRSMAEFCAVLDTLLAILVLVVTFT